MTTNSDFKFLDNVIMAIEHWMGPMSIAVYAPGSDFYKALESIAHLRSCETKLIKELVTFHIFFESEYLPKSVSVIYFLISFSKLYITAIIFPIYFFLFFTMFFLLCSSYISFFFHPFHVAKSSQMFLLYYYPNQGDNK